MQRNRTRLIIPVVALLIIGGIAVVLLSQTGAPGATCGAYAASPGVPVALDGGMQVAVEQGELRFDSESIALADVSTRADWADVVNALPFNLQPQGSLIAFTRCGDVALPARIDSTAPAAGLDAYVWDGVRWQWLVGATDRLNTTLSDLPNALLWVKGVPTAPAIGTEPDPQTGGLAPEYNGVVTELYVAGPHPTTNGSLSGGVAAAPSAAVTPYIVLDNRVNGQTDAATLQALLADATARTTHVEQVRALVAGSGYAGAVIDYAGVPVDQRDNFSALIEELAAALRADGRSLVVVLPMPLSATGVASHDGSATGSADGGSATESADGGSATGSATGVASYDWGRIGRAADVVQIDLPLDVGTYQAGGPVVATLDWAATQVDRFKLQPIISAASVENVNGVDASLSFNAALSGAFNLQRDTLFSMTLGGTINLLSPAGTLTFEASQGLLQYTAQESNGARHLYTADTLAQKLNALAAFQMRGVRIHALQGPDVAPDLQGVVRAYRQQADVAASNELPIAWSIVDGSGAAVVTAGVLVGPRAVWAPTQAGTFTVTAQLGANAFGPFTLLIEQTAGGSDSPLDSAGEVVTDECLNSAYVADVTVPDNTRFDHDAAFTKTWKVRNSGTCAWTEDTAIAFVNGSQLGAPASVDVGGVAVGQSVDVSVAMKSAAQDGTYTGVWRLRDADGFFGASLTVVIRSGAEVAAATPVPPPVSPPISGGPTQYGIHAHYYGYAYDYEFGAQNISSLTNELGLGWVKIQFRWGDYDYFCGGADLNVLNRMVNRANAAGLKVMLSVVTSPPCAHPWTSDVHAPPDDPNSLAGQLGGLADFYRGRIHAIEVWNEQNIDREWVSNPQKLDPARYTEMLKASYNAIKSKDPNILVISGALAPTGFNNRVNAMDDFTYLQEMVAAGASSYMDCVGTHVNALRVPPSAQLGGEFDSLFNPPHHSWYFYNTVRGYQSITGKPACVTEFGVATQEGIGSVPGFEWAASNTQQKQSDWVTEGMGLCRQWGCRLMILWNLDYGPATGAVNDNALYSFLDMGSGRRPVFSAVKNWCAANGCR